MDSSRWSSWWGCSGALLLAWSTWPRWTTCTGTWLLGTFWSIVTWSARCPTLAFPATSRMTPQTPPTLAPWWVLLGIYSGESIAEKKVAETCLWTQDRAILRGTGTWTHLSAGGARWQKCLSGRNNSSWLSRQTFGHRLWGRVSVYSEAMVLLSQWEEGVWKRWFWGNPNRWTVASQTSVSRKQTLVGLTLCHQVEFGPLLFSCSVASR